MRKAHAQLVLEARAVGPALFRFKSDLSRVILLNLVCLGGASELRILLRKLDATAVAARQHIQFLEIEGYLNVQTHETNRRCKIVCVTDKAWQLMSAYEAELATLARRWCNIERE